jgi:pimeloyl-ACP methyl ester carboxylesterase
MARTRINGVELEVEARGTGEAVLLIHGGVIADAYAPLMAGPALTGRYRLITYHRRGYGRSGRPHEPTGIEEQAADARAVLHHLGVDRAHIVGHSYGGAIAFQLALDAADSVHTLVLLEPALMMVPSAQAFFDGVGPAVSMFEAGDTAAAIDVFLRGACGP